MIKFSENTFHLQNEYVSYIFKILENGELGHLYFGKKISHKQNFETMYIERLAASAPYQSTKNKAFALELLKQEYPQYGTGDFRMPAYQIEHENGSRICEFRYKNHEILSGKPFISGLPHTNGDDCETLVITLEDRLSNCLLTLHYHIFSGKSAIVRSSKFTNNSENPVKLLSAMSFCLDLPDMDYEILTLNGAWARERNVSSRSLSYGTTSISSARGTSSATNNPFFALKRPETTENQGEVYGFTLIYSGNFLGSVEVDCYDVSRVTMGINPFEFKWILHLGESFQTPEGVMVYSDGGLNEMSQNFHNLFNENLIKSPYKNKVRPLLINNWEATYFDFNEDSILEIAKKAKETGIELFVLDDGWFGVRNDDGSSLGDWYCNLEKLPNGIAGLCEKINALGLKFGLWIEPEMANVASELYKNHPEYIVSTPNRNRCECRNQLVLDFSRQDVVDYIFNMLCKILDTCNIEYIKWDMNRNITESYSLELPAERQEEFFHRYILGVYNLYERLIARYPAVLFESCASGGARFDAGMLYYAPQAWTSDDTDAIERLHIQYGTSMVYPLSSMGSHVAAVPNHQVFRKTPLKTRADVAYFGTFGYELDLNKLTKEEIDEVTQQILFFKEYRELISFGDFYRLKQGNFYSWMVVSKDKKTAILGYYKILATPNPSLKKVRLVGLDSNIQYSCNGKIYFGDELMNYGFNVNTENTGVCSGYEKNMIDTGDFTSQVYVFKA